MITNNRFEFAGISIRFYKPKEYSTSVQRICYSGSDILLPSTALHLFLFLIQKCPYFKVEPTMAKIFLHATNTKNSDSVADCNPCYHLALIFLDANQVLRNMSLDGCLT